MLSKRTEMVSLSGEEFFTLLVSVVNFCMVCGWICFCSWRACLCVSIEVCEQRNEPPLLFGIKMASVLFLALCWTHGFINS